MNTEGKLALVTGASGGIGAATAKALAAAGASVLLLARRKEGLDRVAAGIAGAGGKAFCHAVDLSDAGAVAGVAKRITEEQGTPDIIVNNAGAGQWKFVDETTPEEAAQMMALPYFAAFNVTHAFLPAMLARNSGHLGFISSVASRIVWPGATAYTAARWAVRGFAEALRADLDRTGLGVTLYESGVVSSEYWAHNPGSRERVPKAGLLVRDVSPEEAGAAIVDGIRRNRRLVVIPFMMRLTYWQHALFPWAVQWLMTRTGYRRQDTRATQGAAR